jgi:hypothetical protein
LRRRALPRAIAPQFRDSVRIVDRGLAADN